eukprot:CAMPEP_0113538406 /NCGR_PEP_ID=MMETSP0015_2-20120614/7346_1 /TAXON_ID=2838 /ORGANISM="Odontella" /LENGTH=971 /DNA_ID=CAMNT_0000437973 /DNA_START=28 /DNA_END=2943 /DNA_ORIENTATION=- /assembly_acc=CAM_ASM_000160
MADATAAPAPSTSSTMPPSSLSALFGSGGEGGGGEVEVGGKVEDGKEAAVGCLVERAILSPSDVAAALDEIWDFVEDVGRSPDLRRTASTKSSAAAAAPPPPPPSGYYRTHGAGWILGSIRESLSSSSSSAAAAAASSSTSSSSTSSSTPRGGALLFESLFGTDELRCSAEGFVLIPSGGADGAGGASLSAVDVSDTEEKEEEKEEEEDDGTVGGRRRRRKRRDARCFAAFAPCEVRFSSSTTASASSSSAAMEGGDGADVAGEEEECTSVSLNAGDVVLWDGNGCLRVRTVAAAAAAAAGGRSSDDRVDNGETSTAAMEATSAAGMFVTMTPAADLDLVDLTSASDEGEPKSAGGCDDDDDVEKKKKKGKGSVVVADEERRWKSRIEFYRRTLTGDRRPDCADFAGGGRTMPDGDGDRLRADSSDEPSSASGGDGSSSSSMATFLRRPHFRYGPPPLTLRLARLHGIVPYHRRGDGATDAPPKPSPRYGSDNAIVRSVESHPEREVVRAIFRGVVFGDESYYRLVPDDGESVEDILSHPRGPPPDPLRVHMERSCRAAVPPVMTRTLLLDGDTHLPGQDKYLGGVASPCGDYIYGVPGFARRVLSVHVPTGRVELIGDRDYFGPFKWLRGVDMPPSPDRPGEYPRGLCIGLPSNADSVLKIDPETQRVSTFGSDTGLLDGAWKYHGGQMYPPTRKLYAVPANAGRVLKIDVYDETLEEIGPDYGPGKQKWYGGIYSAYNDCIYCIPHNETGVLKIDPSKDEVTVIGDHLPKGLWKWHGGLASKDGTKIIGFPNNSDTILVVDVPAERVYTIDGGAKGILSSGRHRRPHNGKYKYLGGSLSPGDGRYAYLFPSCAERILRIDLVTDDVRCVGPLLLEGRAKYQNGFSSENDGAVYGIPQNARCVVRIVPPRGDDDDEEVVDMVYCGDDFLPYGDKFEGGVQGKDGSIYCMPLRAKAVLKVIPPVAPGRGGG